jgi:hypothetical protein
MMKKSVFLLFGILVFFLMIVPSYAITLEVGNFGMKFRDVTFLDVDQDELPGVVPTQPGVLGSGNLWGVASVTTIHGLMGGNIESPLLGAGYWSEGTDGEFLQVVYGGMTLNRTVDGNGTPASSFPFDMYFQDDATTAELAYLKVYKVDYDAMADDYIAGPNVAGGGESGTFGTNIMSGELWLDCIINPYVLANYDANAVFGDLEFVKNSSIETGAATMYLDIIGGTAADLFIRDQFPLFPFAAWEAAIAALFPGTPLEEIYADLKVQSDLTALINPNGTTPAEFWVDSYGWSAVSEDPVTGSVVPEPATMLLLGTGLMGLAGLSRRRKSKKVS